MLSLNNTVFPAFDYPGEVKRICFCDLDETYRPAQAHDQLQSGVTQLETFITDNMASLSLLIGWVTGSNLHSALEKSQGYVTKLPHFIASSLGTELHWCKDGVIHESDEWNARIEETGYSSQKVIDAVAKIKNKNIMLLLQGEAHQGKYKKSFYYPISNEIERDFEWIKQCAAEQNIKVTLTKCNPAAGDPADCYDVEFIPTCCGKEEVLRFLCKSLHIDVNDTWAFGDSFNDIAMLENAGHGYLVSNADPAAQEQFGRVLREKYCFGILSKLKDMIA